MLNEPTMEKLKALKLTAFAEAWATQQKNPDMVKVAFDERLGLLIDAEWLYRENVRLERCLKEAKLRIGNACVEDIDYAGKRELDKTVIRQLATCRWVAEHQNVAITGMTGTGKTYVACALAQQACRKGHRAIYRRAPRFFEELTLAHADGTYGRLLQRLAKVDVLIMTIGALRHRRTRSGGTSLKCWRTGTGTNRPSSLANCRRRSGTTTSAIRQSQTRFAIASSTTLTAWC